MSSVAQACWQLRTSSRRYYYMLLVDKSLSILQLRNDGIDSGAPENYLPDVPSPRRQK